MLEHVTCNLCGLDDCKVVYEATPGIAGDVVSYYRCTSQHLAVHDRIVQCNRCSLMYSNPRESSKGVLENYAQVVDDTYLDEHEGRQLTFARSLNHLERFRKSGNLLDVGCYAGLFLKVAQDRGWAVWGTEPSAWAAQHAKVKLGLRVYQGTLKDAQYPDGYFDVVTLWDVVEHFTDPMSEFHEIHRVLKQDGLLVITTMLMDAMLPKLMRGKYPFLLKMHLTYFTQETLDQTLERTGFKRIACHDHVRVVTMQYLVSRIQPYGSKLHDIFKRAMDFLRWERRTILIPFSGVKTIYATKMV